MKALLIVAMLSVSTSVQAQYATRVIQTQPFQIIEEVPVAVAPVFRGVMFRSSVTRTRTRTRAAIAQPAAACSQPSYACSQTAAACSQSASACASPASACAQSASACSQSVQVSRTRPARLRGLFRRIRSRRAARAGC